MLQPSAFDAFLPVSGPRSCYALAMLTLIIMRHAKSSWKTGHIDHDRPLNGRGRRQGFAGGRWLLEHYPVIDAILCSTSKRTRQTLERLVDAGIDPRSVSFHEEIYEAAPTDILLLLRRIPDEDRTALIIGHYPGVDLLIDTLVGDDALAERFVTSGIAVLEISGLWKDLGTADADARLSTFVTPGRD